MLLQRQIEAARKNRDQKALGDSLDKYDATGEQEGRPGHVEHPSELLGLGLG
ncbi:hypothetical protein D3C86_1556390 [compost metagenome]